MQRLGLTSCGFSTRTVTLNSGRRSNQYARGKKARGRRGSGGGKKGTKFPPSHEARGLSHHHDWSLSCELAVVGWYLTLHLYTLSHTE